MKNFILSLLLLFSLASCASTSHRNEVLNSIRTDGIYISKVANANGVKIKLKFYIKKDNGKDEMRVIVSGLNSEIPDIVSDSKYDTWFIIPSKNNAIQYRITKGGMGISLKHTLSDFEFFKE